MLAQERYDLVGRRWGQLSHDHRCGTRRQARSIGVVVDLDQAHGCEPVTDGTPVIPGPWSPTEDEASRYPQSTTVHAAAQALSTGSTLVPHDRVPLVLTRPAISSTPRAWTEATLPHIEAFACRSDYGISAEVTRLVEPCHAAPAIREAGAAGGTTTDPCSSDPAIAATMGRESITATGPT